MEKCLFCDESANAEWIDSLSRIMHYSCPNCGEYTVSDALRKNIISSSDVLKVEKNIISGYIRRNNDLYLQMEVLTTENINKIEHDPSTPKTLMQRLERVLLYYYTKSSEYGSSFYIRDDVQYSIGYCNNSEEYFRIIDVLHDVGYFDRFSKTMASRTFSVSFRGWSKAEELLTTNINSNSVFVAIGFSGDYLKVLDFAIKPACEELGFDAFLITEKEYNNDINDKIIADIKSSKFVIADFTYNNQGVYFEAGYAQGRGLEVIRTCNKSWFDGQDDKGVKNHLHFDVNHYNFILWDNYEDLKEKMKNRIRATIL